MGFVDLDFHDYDIARWFGPDATMRHAKVVLSRAKALEDARAKHSSVSDRLSVTTHAGGIHHMVELSVIGGNGVQVAKAHEFGAFNERAGEWVDGHHAMRDAAYA